MCGGLRYRDLHVEEKIALQASPPSVDCRGATIGRSRAESREAMGFELVCLGREASVVGSKRSIENNPKGSNIAHESKERNG